MPSHVLKVWQIGFSSCWLKLKTRKKVKQSQDRKTVKSNFKTRFTVFKGSILEASLAQTFRRKKPNGSITRKHFFGVFIFRQKSKKNYFFPACDIFSSSTSFNYFLYTGISIAWECEGGLEAGGLDQVRYDRSTPTTSTATTTTTTTHDGARPKKFESFEYSFIGWQIKVGSRWHRDRFRRAAGRGRCRHRLDFDVLAGISKPVLAGLWSFRKPATEFLVELNLVGKR